MNISSWTDSQIMQLPDHLFGRRFPIGCYVVGINGGADWDIAEIAFPERFVLWEVHVTTDEDDILPNIFRIGMADQLPVNSPEFDRAESLLHGVGVERVTPREISYNMYTGFHLVNLRNPFHAMGRRLVFECNPGVEKTGALQLVVVVSSFPTEIPDWFLKA